MRYRGYSARIEHDDETHVFRGRVDGIRDIVTFEADRAEDVEREFRISVDEYLTFCAEQGIAPEPAVRP